MTERDKESGKNEPQSLLAQTIQEFKQGPIAPELVTKTFQSIWQVRGESAGLEFTIPPCDRTAEELAELERAGRQIGFLPEQLMRQQDRTILARVFPQLGSYSVQEGNTVTNEVDRSGWFDYEASIDAPYLNTTEDQLIDRIDSEGEGLNMNLLEMNLNGYIVAGEDIRFITGKYLDQDGTSWSRLLGSRGRGLLVRASFGSNGYLHVYRFLSSSENYPYLGWSLYGSEKPLSETSIVPAIMC